MKADTWAGVGGTEGLATQITGAQITTPKEAAWRRSPFETTINPRVKLIYNNLLNWNSEVLRFWVQDSRTRLTGMIVLYHNFCSALVFVSLVFRQNIWRLSADQLTVKTIITCSHTRKASALSTKGAHWDMRAWSGSSETQLTFSITQCLMKWNHYRCDTILSVQGFWTRCLRQKAPSQLCFSCYFNCLKMWGIAHLKTPDQ